MTRAPTTPCSSYGHRHPEHDDALSCSDSPKTSLLPPSQVAVNGQSKYSRGSKLEEGFGLVRKPPDNTAAATDGRIKLVLLQGRVFSSSVPSQRKVRRGASVANGGVFRGNRKTASTLLKPRGRGDQ